MKYHDHATTMNPNAALRELLLAGILAHTARNERTLRIYRDSIDQLLVSCGKGPPDAVAVMMSLVRELAAGVIEKGLAVQEGRRKRP